MGLLERLDAIDRRLRLAPGTSKRPPGRRARWVADHVSATVLLCAVVISVPQVIMLAVVAPGGRAWTMRVVLLLLLLLVVCPSFGYVLAASVRNGVRRWDDEHRG